MTSIGIRSLGEAMAHGEVVWSASFSPDGKRVVTASIDKTARVWEAYTGKAVRNSAVMYAPIE